MLWVGVSNQIGKIFDCYFLKYFLADFVAILFIRA